MITFKKPKPGDIVTFYYSDEFSDVHAEYIGEYHFKDGFNNNCQRPIIKLMQDISYTSTHHSGETFRKGMEINFFEPIFETINGKKYFKTILFRIKLFLYDLFDD